MTYAEREQEQRRVAAEHGADFLAASGEKKVAARLGETRAMVSVLIFLRQ